MIFQTMLAVARLVNTGTMGWSMARRRMVVERTKTALESALSPEALNALKEQVRTEKVILTVQFTKEDLQELSKGEGIYLIRELVAKQDLREGGGL